MNSIEFTTTRANPAVDPVLSVWGWQIPVYLFLAGLVAGIMIVASLQELKSAEEWEPRLSRILPIVAMILLSRDTFSLRRCSTGDKPSPTDGTPQDNLSVSMDNPDTADDQIPDGSIVIRGQKETAFALQNISISADNSNQNAIAPTRFNANLSTTEIQAARDTTSHSTSIVVYDESGAAHTMTTTFTHSGIPNEWLWQITMDGGESIVNGNTGRITFGQDGSPSSFTFDDGLMALLPNPMNGSNQVSVNLNVGSPGSFAGITQFRIRYDNCGAQPGRLPHGQASTSLDQ